MNVIALLNLNTPKLCRLRGAYIRPFLENLSVEEAIIIRKKLRDSIENTLNAPLKPFVQIIICLLEKNYIASS